MAGQYKLFYSNDLKCNLGCGILKIEIFNSTDTTTHDIIMGDQKIVRNKSTYIPTHHFTFSQCKANRFEDKFSQKLSSVEIHTHKFLLFQFNGETIIGENSIMCSKDDLCQKKSIIFSGTQDFLLQRQICPPAIIMYKNRIQVCN